VNALLAGTADLIWNFPPDAVEKLKSSPGFEVTAVPSTRVYDIGLCATSGPFASKQARQAIQYALDRDALNEGAVSGTGTPWQTIVSSASPYYKKQFNTKYSYNLKKAKALLKQAGIAEGTTIKALSSTAPPQPVFGEIVQSQLKKVGLDVQYQSTPNLVDDASRQKPDMVFAAFDPGLWGLALGTQSTLNICGWSNPQVTADLAVVGDATKSADEKQKAVDDIQQVVLDESPLVVTVLSPLSAAHTTKVKGVDIITNPYGPNLETVYMTK
jgi:ABC-type transport system substrate-binding protein